MALPDFPSNGQLLFQGYTEKPESAVRRTEMESGPAKQVQRFSRVMVSRPVTYKFTKTDYNAFLTWFKDTVNRAGWFNWTDPKDSAVKTARIVNGEIDPKPTRSDLGIWLVSFKIETWE